MWVRPTAGSCQVAGASNAHGGATASRAVGPQGARQTSAMYGAFHAAAESAQAGLVEQVTPTPRRRGSRSLLSLVSSWLRVISSWPAYDGGKRQRVEDSCPRYTRSRRGERVLCCFDVLAFGAPTDN